MKIIRRYAAQDDFRAAPDRVMVITQGRHRLLPRVVISGFGYAARVMWQRQGGIGDERSTEYRPNSDHSHR
jgi:hypothetical protein